MVLNTSLITAKNNAGDPRNTGYYEQVNFLALALLEISSVLQSSLLSHKKSNGKCAFLQLKTIKVVGFRSADTTS